MSTPYRRSSQHSVLWVIIVFSGIGGSLAIGSMIPQSVHWCRGLAVFMVPMSAAIALWVVLTKKLSAGGCNRHE